MKKILLLLVFLTSANVWACDYCNIYLGIVPTDYKNSFGLHYRSRLLQGTYLVAQNNGGPKHFGHFGSDSMDLDVKEIYTVFELRGRYFVSDRFNVLLSLPFLNNYRSENGSATMDIYGLGDPTIMGNYQIYNTIVPDSSKTNWIHRVVAGAGLKLPLGRTGKTYRGDLVDHDLQPGSGSLDFLVRLDYLARYKRLGLGLSTTYKMNTTGANEYRYGNTMNSRLNMFYLAKVGDTNWQIAPKIGLIAEHAAIDKDSGADLINTGGTVGMLDTGLDVFWKGFAINVTYNHAVFTYINSDIIPVKNRFSASFTYNF